MGFCQPCKLRIWESKGLRSLRGWTLTRKGICREFRRIDETAGKSGGRWPWSHTSLNKLRVPPAMNVATGLGMGTILTLSHPVRIRVTNNKVQIADPVTHIILIR
jgi:hypothetical protein